MPYPLCPPCSLKGQEPLFSKLLPLMWIIILFSIQEKFVYVIFGSNCKQFLDEIVLYARICEQKLHRINTTVFDNPTKTHSPNGKIYKTKAHF